MSVYTSRQNIHTSTFGAISFFIFPLQIIAENLSQVIKLAATCTLERYVYRIVIEHIRSRDNKLNLFTVSLEVLSSCYPHSLVSCFGGYELPLGHIFFYADM